MLAPTHSVFGIFLTLIILAVFGVQWSLHWTVILCAVLGSIIPDIDHPKSVIGRMFTFISVPLERRYGHRTITHSLVGWIISSVIFAFIVVLVVWILGFISDLGFRISELAPRWIAAFSISYLSHLVLDMVNPRGSQMFWPDPGRDVIPRNPKFRPESGAKIEVVIFFILLILVFLAFPVSKYGIGSSLRWLLATPGAAIEEFKTLKNHAYLEFEGVFRETKELVEGQGEILDADRKRLVILYKGNIYSLSDELSADILASHVRVKKTNIPIKIERKEFENKTREYLESQIPKGTLVSGTIHLPKDMDIKFPSFPGTYKVMEQKGNDLILRFATREQIEKLALGEFFKIQQRKDLAGLSKLKAEAAKVKSRIAELEKAEGLTPLGQELLLGKEKQAKVDQQLAELRSKLEEINVKIDEVGLKIKSRKFVFSGDVYIRQ